MKKIILIIMGFSLLGCATEKGYREYLTTWQGADTLTLVRAWGAPDQVYSLGEHDFYVYSREVYEKNPNYPYTCPDLQKIDKNDTDLMKDVKRDQNERTIKQCIKDKQIEPRENFYHCTTTFELFENKVIQYSFKGNDCVK